MQIKIYNTFLFDLWPNNGAARVYVVALCTDLAVRVSEGIKHFFMFTLSPAVTRALAQANTLYYESNI